MRSSQNASLGFSAAGKGRHIEMGAANDGNLYFLLTDEGAPMLSLRLDEGKKSPPAPPVKGRRTLDLHPAGLYPLPGGGEFRKHESNLRLLVRSEASCVRVQRTSPYYVLG
jgi:hypothetical protein